MTTPAEPAELAAVAALEVPGVADLHGGAFGEVATYLPGRRVTGIRLGADTCAVHIVVEYPADLYAVAAAVRDRLGPLVGVPVDVTIEDLRIPSPDGEHPTSEVTP